MLRKIVFLSIVLFSGIALLSPGAAYSDSGADRRLELAVPGTFILHDPDGDQRAEFVKFQISVKAHRKRNFIVTGNLEGLRHGSWVALGTTVVSFNKPAERQWLELVFSVDQIIKYQIYGPFRVNIGVKEGQWEAPAEIVGFSPKYHPEDFEKAVEIEFGSNSGEITTIAQARRAAETWAWYQGIELGNLKEIFYNYDQWQCDYQTKSGEMVRFLVEPRGLVKSYKITGRTGRN